MANPKYADLPGIARDQPDVYETNELPEADQSHLLSDALLDQSDNVEQIDLSAKDAYNRFKGKSLDARNVDFTDSIGKKSYTGYGSQSAAEWEMLDNASKERETPLQTYNRLQYELKELHEHVQLMKDSSKNDDSSSATALLQQMEHLQKELQALHLEQVLGSETLKEISDPLGTLHKKLLLQIEASKKVASEVKSKKQPASKSSPTSTGSALTYELYVNPEQSKLQEISKIADLEQRLRNLENIVGQDVNKLSFLSSSSEEKTVMAAVNLLSAKLNLLDPAHLELIDGRLQLLHQSMQQVAEKKQLVEDAEKQNKIAELYELAKKVEGMSSTLPDVVKRLVALQNLHNQALQFSKAMTQLDTAQQQVTQMLRGNEDLLKKVQDTFQQNNETINKNLSSLSSRMAALEK